MNLAVWSIISGALISLYVELDKKYKMKVRDFRKIKVAPEIISKISTIDFDRLQHCEFFSELVCFIDIVTDNFSDSDLGNFYNNINDLKFRKTPFLYRSSGYYDFSNNKIVVKKNKEACIYHELFHMASSRLVLEDVYCGFQQINKNSSIGVGINEGYTQFLVEKYFSEYGYFGAYPFQTFAVSVIEKIIGEDKMQNFYLTNNLIGLVRELQKYCTINDIMQFISNLDCLTPTPYNHKSYNTKKINEVYTFLGKICFSKIGEKLNMKLVDLDEYFLDVYNFFTELTIEGGDFIASDLSDVINRAKEGKRKIYKKNDIISY